jgi:hypothetical protein
MQVMISICWIGIVQSGDDKNLHACSNLILHSGNELAMALANRNSDSTMEHYRITTN